MKYSFTCPAGDFNTTVEAQNEQEAMGKLSEQAMQHASKTHPEMMRDPQQVRNLVRNNMQRV